MSITVHTGGPNGSTTRPAAASFAARLATLSYGGVAYLIFLGTFLYAVGFVSQHLVPKDINTGPASPLITALLTNLVLMSIFDGSWFEVNSLTAPLSSKWAMACSPKIGTPS